MKTYVEWMHEVISDYAREHTRQRLGQFISNQLFKDFPELYSRVGMSGTDPFYSNELIPVFLDWLKKNWKPE